MNQTSPAIDMLEPVQDFGGAAQPLLQVQGLTKHFPVRGGLFGKSKTVRAVYDVSFSIAKGETVGIVGESGCGKSTTARLLMHLMKRDAGDIVYDGMQVGRALSLRELRRGMQMVFQDSYASLNPRLTIEESIAFGPKVHGAHSLLNGIGANAGVVRGEGAVAEHRVEEQIHRGHGNHESSFFAGPLEVANDGIAFGGSGVDWNQVVVVEVHSPGAYLGQHLDNFGGRNQRADEVAKRVATAATNSPEAKGELHFRIRRIIGGHENSVKFASCDLQFANEGR